MPGLRTCMQTDTLLGSSAFKRISSDFTWILFLDVQCFELERCNSRVVARCARHASVGGLAGTLLQGSFCSGYIIAKLMHCRALVLKLG